jgi:hypothetical protein
LICAVLAVPQDTLKSHVHCFYLAHYCLFLPLFFVSDDRCRFFFSPSFLIVTYVSLSSVIGGYAFAKGYVLFPEELRAYQRWPHVDLTTAYFMVCSLLAVAAYFLANGRGPRRRVLRLGGSLCLYGPQLAIGVILLAVFSILSVGLAFLGGNGDFSVGPRTFGFLVIAIVLAKTRWRYRHVVYVGLLLLFAATEYGNRRFALLLGVSVVFMEAAHLRDLRLSFRRLLTCAVVLALAVILQMSMTVARGLEGFEGSYWQTFHHLDSFVKLDNAVAYSLKTTEGPTLFWHGNNGLHYVLDDSSLLCYGSTLAKVLFVPVPRSVWPNKPQSMVHHYTSRWNPSFRRKGGSTGINVYAEYFWNFHFFGVLCVLPIFYLLNRVFFFYLRRLRAGTIWPFVYVAVGYNSLLTYGRGHGLYNPAAEVSIALIVQWLVFNPIVTLLRAPNQTLLSSKPALGEGQA